MIRSRSFSLLNDMRPLKRLMVLALAAGLTACGGTGPQRSADSSTAQEGEEVPEALVRAADAAWQSTERASSRYYYQQLFQRRPDDPAIRYRFGESVRLSGEPQIAMEVLRPLVEASDVPTHALVSFAKASLQAGDSSGARAAADRAVAQAPNDSEALTVQGVVLSAVGDHAGAIRAFEGALANGAQDEARVLNNIGLAYAQMGHGDSARASLVRALRLEPANRTIAQNLSMVQNAIDSGSLALRPDPAPAAPIETAPVDSVPVSPPTLAAAPVAPAPVEAAEPEVAATEPADEAPDEAPISLTAEAAPPPAAPAAPAEIPTQVASVVEPAEQAADTRVTTALRATAVAASAASAAVAPAASAETEADPVTTASLTPETQGPGARPDGGAAALAAPPASLPGVPSRTIQDPEPGTYLTNDRRLNSVLSPTAQRFLRSRRPNPEGQPAPVTAVERAAPAAAEAEHVTPPAATAAPASRPQLAAVPAAGSTHNATGSREFDELMALVEGASAGDIGSDIATASLPEPATTRSGPVYSGASDFVGLPEGTQLALATDEPVRLRYAAHDEFDRLVLDLPSDALALEPGLSDGHVQLILPVGTEVDVQRMRRLLRTVGEADDMATDRALVVDLRLVDGVQIRKWRIDQRLVLDLYPNGEGGVVDQTDGQSPEPIQLAALSRAVAAPQPASAPVPGDHAYVPTERPFATADVTLPSAVEDQDADLVSASASVDAHATVSDWGPEREAYEARLTAVRGGADAVPVTDLDVPEDLGPAGVPSTAPDLGEADRIAALRAAAGAARAVRADDVPAGVARRAAVDSVPDAGVLVGVAPTAALPPPPPIIAPGRSVDSRLASRVLQTSSTPSAAVPLDSDPRQSTVADRRAAGLSTAVPEPAAAPASPIVAQPARPTSAAPASQSLRVGAIPPISPHHQGARDPFAGRSWILPQSASSGGGVATDADFGR